jgi:hypothetical protein
LNWKVLAHSTLLLSMSPILCFSRKRKPGPHSVFFIGVPNAIFFCQL